MGSKYGQASAVIGVVGQSYTLDFFDFVDLPGGSGSLDPATSIDWVFGDGNTDTGQSVSYSWRSPGVFDLTITYYLVDNPLLQTSPITTVKIGLDPEAWGEGGSTPYDAGVASVLSCVGKLKTPGQATRLCFYLSPMQGMLDEGNTGEPDFSNETDEFFNLAREIESVFSQSIMRYPVPKVEEFENGFYAAFESDVLYLGTSDKVRNLQIDLGEALQWDYTHDVDECYPHRVFEAMMAAMQDDNAMDVFEHILQPYKPYSFILPEGKGLRLAREELVNDLLNDKVSDLTVKEQREVTAKPNEKKNWSLLWLRRVLWELSNVIYRYVRSINFSEYDDQYGRMEATYVLVTFNPEDLSLGVRIVNWLDDADEYGNTLLSWRHVATQVDFTKSNDAAVVAAEHPLSNLRMYGDRTGAKVKVLSYNKASELVGEEIQADEKIIDIDGAFYLYSPDSPVLTPVGGSPSAANGGDLHVMVTTRGGGATLQTFPEDENPFLGNMVSVQSWLGLTKEAVPRWKGLVNPPATGELIVEGVDPDYEVYSKKGVDGGTIHRLDVSDWAPDDPTVPPEYVIEVDLGPKDLGDSED